MNDSSHVRFPSRSTRYGVLVFGVLVYALFLTTFCALIAFVEGLFLPKTVAAGVPSGLGEMLLVDSALLGLFGVQHAIMARRRFKNWWTRIVPAAAERSCFVLATCSTLLLLMVQWRSSGDGLWHVESTVVANGMRALGWGGWLLVLYATFVIDHFKLFGLRQVIEFFRGIKPAAPSFEVRSVYRLVRHPLYVGFLLAFWCTPEMSVGRFVFASLISLYLVVGIRMEERSLRLELGDDYVDYRGRVPMLVPFVPMRPERGGVTVSR